MTPRDESPHEGAAPPLGQTDTEAARMAELEQRCEELNTRWLRAQADYQNQRRRAQLELEGEIFRALQPLLDELLLVADYLDMALNTQATHDETRNLLAGVQLTRSKLGQALELCDVRAVPASGPFDPALHEAAESRPTREHPAGTILATVRPGYTWQGRILRPARVVVAAEPTAE